VFATLSQNLPIILSAGYETLLRVNGHPVEFSIDTGSEVSVLNEATCSQLKLHLSKPSKLLKAANGQGLDVCGEVEVELCNNMVVMSVMKGVKQNLLGVKEIKALKLIEMVNVVNSTEKKEWCGDER